MANSKRVWVELSDDLHTIRIFRNAKDAGKSPAWDAGRVALAIRARATEDLRRAVFTRDGYACTHCGAVVDWQSGEMHERQWRGRGGEMSLENSTTLCRACHSNDPVAGHGKRQPQWSKR